MIDPVALHRRLIARRWTYARRPASSRPIHDRENLESPWSAAGSTAPELVANVSESPLARHRWQQVARTLTMAEASAARLPRLMICGRARKWSGEVRWRIEGVRKCEIA